MQNDFNNAMQVIQIAALDQINETLAKMGCNSIQELQNKIFDVKMQIATFKDEGKDTTNLNTLLNEMEELKRAYEKEEARIEKEKQEQHDKAVAWFVIAMVILSVVFFGVLGNCLL